jgi:hypothetical protein
LYRANVAKAVAYFLLALETRNKTYEFALENPKESGAFDPSLNIQALYKLNGYDIQKTGPFCNHI